MSDASGLIALQRDMAELRRRWSAVEAALTRPAQIPAVDLTAQGAAIGTTTLYAVPASWGGLYRVNWYAKVTQSATVSSTLGGLTIAFTDKTDSVAQSILCGGFRTDGAYANSSAGNVTTTTLNGTAVIWAKASTNITYAFAYASSGATPMQYELHIKLQFLG